MEHERKLPPIELEKAGFTVPKRVNFKCSICGSINDKYARFSLAQLRACNEFGSMFLHLTCDNCRKIHQYDSKDVFNLIQK